MKIKRKTSGHRWKFKKKIYQVRPEAEGQSLMFGLSDIEQALLKRKKKPLSLEERQAFRELQGGGLDRAREPGPKIS